MTKAQKAEQQEAITRLREWIKPGDTVYTILDHVSSSGMSRAIRVVLPTINTHGETNDVPAADCSVDFLHPNWAVGKALGLRHWKRNGREQDALVIGGCGMDMGFHLVYELSHTLYGGRLTRDIYKDSATHDQPGGQLLTREGCDPGYVIVGGYRCLGKGKCPSNYHSNHRDFIRCEGTRQHNPDGPDFGTFCYRPDAFSRREVPEDWPRKQVEIDGELVATSYLACIETNGGNAREICPTCKGEGQLPNPEGPERWDLIHTDGYALRHRWL